MTDEQCKADYEIAVTNMWETVNNMRVNGDDPVTINVYIAATLGEITNQYVLCMMDNFDMTVGDCARREALEEANSLLLMWECIAKARNAAEIKKCKTDYNDRKGLIAENFKRCQKNFKPNKKPQLPPGYPNLPIPIPKFPYIPALSSPSYNPPMTPAASAPLGEGPSILPFTGRPGPFVEPLAAAGESSAAGFSVPNPEGLTGPTLQIFNGFMIGHDIFNIIGQMSTGKTLGEAIDAYVNEIPQLLPGLPNPVYKPKGPTGIYRGPEA